MTNPTKKELMTKTKDVLASELMKANRQLNQLTPVEEAQEPAVTVESTYENMADPAQRASITGAQATLAIADTVVSSVNRGFEVLISALKLGSLDAEHAARQAVATMIKNRLVGLYEQKLAAVQANNELAKLGVAVDIDATRGNLRESMVELGIAEDATDKFLSKLDEEYEAKIEAIEEE